MRPNRSISIVVSTSLFFAAAIGLVNAPDSRQVFGQDSLERDYGDQLQRIAPRDIDSASQSFEINKGLRIELMASEPMVVDPVAITFDEWGRAYVVEMRGYSERADQLLGRVKRLEDTDQDGRFDKSTVFADKFRWPTAVVCTGAGS